MNQVLQRLRQEKQGKIKGGLYHKVQVALTYNSNHMEGSRLTEEQTRFIFETNTVGDDCNGVPLDDLVETTNHFACIDWVIDNAQNAVTETGVKELHRLLKQGTTQSRIAWFGVGEYKQKPNEVGGVATCPPKQVKKQMQDLLAKYAGNAMSLQEVVAFHFAFESIHPFQDGNGRVGRLLILWQCLQNAVVPFVIESEHKAYYIRGLREYTKQPGFLQETCLSAQDKFAAWLHYFEIAF
ncbi:MAG: Fic family protein [Firmicutes bacterium]|nr:Fic family protein [Bacillota bacterium]